MSSTIISIYSHKEAPKCVLHEPTMFSITWSDITLFIHGAHNIEAFEQACLAAFAQASSEPEDVAICEQCIDESIDPPALAETQDEDNRWLCEYHAEREAAATPERAADEWYDQQKDLNNG